MSETTIESPTGWITPRRKDYEWECCVCSSRHLIDFRVNKKYKNRDIIQIRVKPWKKVQPDGIAVKQRGTK